MFWAGYHYTRLNDSGIVRGQAIARVEPSLIVLPKTGGANVRTGVPAEATDQYRPHVFVQVRTGNDGSNVLTGHLIGDRRRSVYVDDDIAVHDHNLWVLAVQAQ